jgi:hypothetical protein
MKTRNFADVFNDLRQLVSDIGYHVMTCMPQRKFFMAAWILVFDFELFIGARRQLVSDIDCYVMTCMPQRKFFCGNKDFNI